jgi:hypothetical protein
VSVAMTEVGSIGRRSSPSAGGGAGRAFLVEPTGTRPSGAAADGRSRFAVRFLGERQAIRRSRRRRFYVSSLHD